MDNNKNDLYFLKRIIFDLEFVFNHTRFLNQEELEKNELLIDSILFRLIQVSENSDRLSESFKNQRNSIPWRAIKGMRNRLVHDYGNVDLMVVYDTVKNDIPDLIEELNKILK